MAVKNVYLNFLSGNVPGLLYDNPIAGENSFEVTMQAAGLDPILIQSILSRLVERFSGDAVNFVTEEPAGGIFHTVYIGRTDDFGDFFDGFSSFAEKADDSSAAEGFVNLAAIPLDDDLIADQIGSVVEILTEGAISQTGTIADYAVPAVSAPAVVPLFTAANAATVYEATADDFAAKLQEAKENEEAGNESILKLTGGSFGTGNVFADGVTFQITGGSTALNKYFYGGASANTDSDTSLIALAFTGNVTVSSAASVARGFVGGGNFQVLTKNKAFSGVSTALTVTDAADAGILSVERLAGGAVIGANPDLGLVKGRVSVSFDSSLTVDTENVSVTYIAVGGSLIGGSGNLIQTGNTSVVISGGTFAAVGGGNFLQHIKAGTTLKGNSSVLITGGTFNGNIFGAHVSLQSSANTQLDVIGDASVTVDCSLNEICFSKNSSIVAGNSTSSTDQYLPTGNIKGNATVTFRGSAQNLKGFCGVVWGDCGKSVTYTDGSWEDHVENSSTLVFDHFVCTSESKFNASRICCFDTYTVKNNSHVVISNSINARGVADWNISWNGSTDGDNGETNAALVFEGEFSQADFDQSYLTLSYDDEETLEIGDSWTVMESRNIDFFENFSSCSKVKLFQEDTDYDVKKGAYVSDSYRLKLEEEDNGLMAMVLTRTA